MFGPFSKSPIAVN